MNSRQSLPHLRIQRILAGVADSSRASTKYSPVLRLNLVERARSKAASLQSYHSPQTDVTLISPRDSVNNSGCKRSALDAPLLAKRLCSPLFLSKPKILQRFRPLACLTPLPTSAVQATRLPYSAPNPSFHNNSKKLKNSGSGRLILNLRPLTFEHSTMTNSVPCALLLARNWKLVRCSL